MNRKGFVFERAVEEAEKIMVHLPFRFIDERFAYFDVDETTRLVYDDAEGKIIGRYNPS